MPLASVSTTELPETTSNPYRLTGKKPGINTTPAYNVPPPNIPQYTPSALQAPPIASVSSYTESSHTAAVPSINTSSQVVGSSVSTQSVVPVQAHWFYRRAEEEYWFPFSIIDSNKLEEAYIRSQADPSIQVSAYIAITYIHAYILYALCFV